ncbi:MAG: GNAT family acetyltransferase [Rubripirellula sp.]
MHIRPFLPSDETAVILLWQRAGLTRPWNDPRKDIVRKLRVQSQAQWFLVGLLDEQMIASVMVGYEGHRGWINYLAVDPDFRRAGHGRELMNHAEALLFDCGCPKVNLQIRKDNLEAIAFYEVIWFAKDEVVSYGKRLISDT